MRKPFPWSTHFKAMKYSLLILLSVLFFKPVAHTQNLTGTWLAENSDYKIVLVHIGDSCFGYTYDTGMGYCKANFLGVYDSATKKLKGTNSSFIERTFTHSLSSYRLTYSKQGDAAYLRGKLTPKQAAMKIMSFGIGVPIAYKKFSDDIDTTKLMAARLAGQRPVELVEIPVDTPLAEIATMPSPPPTTRQQEQELSRQKESRKSELVNTIETSADSLRLTLHDNGEIDNDTVTVFLNGKIIVNRLGLSAKAYETFIPLKDRDAVYSIELMANNLGTIPPNTAYLTIYAGRQKYELRVSSDYTVNARIDVKYVPAEAQK